MLLFIFSILIAAGIWLLSTGALPKGANKSEIAAAIAASSVDDNNLPAAAKPATASAATGEKKRATFDDSADAAPSATTGGCCGGGCGPSAKSTKKKASAGGGCCMNANEAHEYGEDEDTHYIDEASKKRALESLATQFPKRILIAYATQRGTARSLAHRLFSSILACRYNDAIINMPEVLDVKDVDLDTLHTSWDLVILVVSTFTGGQAPESAAAFADLFSDMANDFRFPRDHFAPVSEATKRKHHNLDLPEIDTTDVAVNNPKGKESKAAEGDADAEATTTATDAAAAAATEKKEKIAAKPQLNMFRHPPQFAIFGLGDLAYGDNFNKFAHTLDHNVKSLGGRTITPSVFSSEARLQPLFAIFTKAVLKFIDKKWVTKYENAMVKGGLDDSDATSIATTMRGAKPARDPSKALDEDAPFETDSERGDGGEEDEESDADSAQEGDGHRDLEDMVEDPNKKQQLLYPRLRDNLSKQGYRLIGSHSAVKLCRWTKSMLRGRGGCYKHTFYNISSFQCMEMTPSLACANKCVFCWRHGTNPVGRAFTWEMDSPEFLIEQAMAEHRSMIKQMRGVPGVQPDRFQEAMTIKHCALSLVGEPIMYPEINRYMELLHKSRISSFMVTNAQFPERIAQLCPVTQLYLSIDAATKDELKRIDRPLFEDFWERFLACIDELSLKRQRTVFRLTLVNDYNITNLQEYAKLVHKGNPDFIEVKGVTYCGVGGAADLTMKNVPYHEEVVKFCVDLIEQIGGDAYEIACEHEHSCCMLIARKNFKINGIWHTWIDYDKFFELCESGRTDFTSIDYAAPTPAWAVFNSEEKGFDPRETRHRRTKPITNGC